MPFSKLIITASIIIWLLPPLRQFRGRFFYYFLLQAISDPVVSVLFLLGVYSLPFYFIKNIVQILSIWKPGKLELKTIYIIPLLALAWFVCLKVEYMTFNLLMIILHVIIISLVFYIMTVEIFDYRRIKVFYILIFLYELSIMLKYVFKMAAVHTGILFFYLTNAFEVLLGLSFIFICEEKTRLIFLLKERD